MTSININEAKAHLSHYLELVQKGEIVTICKRNIPIAEIKPINLQKRKLGFAEGEVSIPDSFFDPLPDEELRGWWCGEDPEKFIEKK